MQKAKHAERRNRDELVIHENPYEEWRFLLAGQGILSKDGRIDLELLEKKYPGKLNEDQVIWIERMQKGEVFEEGDDIQVEEAPPVNEAKNKEEEPEEEPAPPVAKKTKAPIKAVEEPEEEPEEEVIEEEAEEEVAPPPPPGAPRKEGEAEEAPAYEVGQTLKIQVEEDGEAEEVTVVKIAKDGIHLASSKDEEVEYLVDADELKEMII